MGKEATYLVEGSITVPVELKIKLNPTGNKEIDMQRIAELVDEILNEEIVAKVEAKLTMFSGRKIQIQTEELTVEWDTVTHEEEIKTFEKSDTEEEDEKEGEKEGVPEEAG